MTSFRTGTGLPAYWPRAYPPTYPVTPPLAQGTPSASLSAPVTRPSTPWTYSGIFKAKKQKSQQAATQYAERFCQATMDIFGTEDKQVKQVLKEVHRDGLMPEFQKAVKTLAAQRGKKFKNVEAVLHKEFASNPVEKLFKNAPLKESMDYLKLGRNTFSGTGWDYRLNGMYRSLADFGKVCKNNPVMSTAVIGSVAVLGHLYPFLGAASGVAILGWSGAFTLINELKARKHPIMDAHKAACYKNSGENMAAFLITGVGAKGIWEGNKLGKAVYSASTQQSTKTGASLIPSHAKALWHATKAKQPPGQHKMNYFESFLFVSGLFDNVLLPFNWLADKMEGKEDKDKPKKQ